MVGMKRFRKRNGFAALVDSLGFLAVAMIVSITLCASFSPPEPQATDWSDQVSEAHRSLLGCEVRLDLKGTLLPSTSVSSLAVMFASGRDPGFGESLVQVADRVLGELIPSSMSYEWTISYGGRVCLSCGENCSTFPTLYSSTIALSSGNGLESRLVVWPSLRGQYLA
ncbi:MAG: hypothetical protein LUO79_00045 [Methanomassiliicoccales archaeon]|nr:hypothetical protein [Methanomassiliicoccales archaeon]